MASRWVKAVFLVVIAVILLLYTDKFVSELKQAVEQNFTAAFDWTWDLLTILMWILIAWLFVDAALIIVLSFQEQRYTLGDVMKRLQLIERKVGVPQNESSRESEVETEEIEAVEPGSSQEEYTPPPPPKE